MKIAFFTTYYPPFLHSFYKLNSEITGFTYHSYQQLILDQFFADTGSAFHYSKQAGHDCFLIIANCEPLQKLWAKENSITYSVDNWQKEIALAQLKFFLPDVLFIESVFEFYGDFLKSCLPYCKKINAWISTPFKDNLDLSGISLILSSTPDFVTKFKNQGISAEYLLPAFDARVLEHIPQDSKKDIPFSFVGGWSHVHLKRKEIISELVEKTKLQIWGYGYKKEYSKKSLSYYKNLIFPEDQKVLHAYQGEAWGLDMFGILNRSVITFNIHESLLNGRVGNMRMFEATGAGTLLLNDKGINLAELFTPGKEIETYSSVDEAIEKVNYYTAHPEQAKAISLAAQKRTLISYNYENYVNQLTHFFAKYL